MKSSGALELRRVAGVRPDHQLTGGEQCGQLLQPGPRHQHVLGASGNDGGDVKARQLGLHVPSMQRLQEPTTASGDIRAASANSDSVVAVSSAAAGIISGRARRSIHRLVPSERCTR